MEKTAQNGGAQTLWVFVCAVAVAVAGFFVTQSLKRHTVPYATRVRSTAKNAQAVEWHRWVRVKQSEAASGETPLTRADQTRLQTMSRDKAALLLPRP